jgi:hypothetical protein
MLAVLAPAACPHTTEGEAANFGDRIVSRDLRPTRSSDLTLPGYFMRRLVKGKGHTNKLHVVHKVKDNADQENAAIPLVTTCIRQFVASQTVSTIVSYGPETL